MALYNILVRVGDTNRELSLFDYTPTNVTYNVTNISDIQSLKSSGSKSIDVPWDETNIEIFSNIADLSTSSDFNRNKKTRCWVMVGPDVQLEGYLRLTNVNDDDGLKKLTIQIFGDNNNLFINMGDKLLTDLNMSRYDHEFTSQNIIESWTASWDKGYYYPLVDRGKDWDLTDLYNGIFTKDFRPATNVRCILEQIFYENGYGIDSRFIDTATFSEVYVDYNMEFISSATGSNLLDIHVGVTGSSQNVTFGSTVNVPSSNANDYYALPSRKIPFNNETSPYGDPSNLWNTSTYEYTAGAIPPINQVFIINLHIINNNSDLTYLEDCDDLQNHTNLKVLRSRNPNTGATVSGGYIVACNNIQAPLYLRNSYIPSIQFIGNDEVKCQLVTNPIPQLYPGEKIWVEFQPYQKRNDLPYIPFGGFNTFVSSDPLYRVEGGSAIFNSVPYEVGPGQLIKYNTILPKNIKQRDFVSSVFKMFNIMCEPSKEAENVLCLEPWDDYYNSGEIEDMTDQIDMLKPIDTELLSEVAKYKRIILTYKKDADYYNKYYTSATNEIYGQYNYEIDNEFNKDDKTIDVLFSPTPLVKVPQSTQFIIPKIMKEQTGGFINNNLRIGYRKLVTSPYSSDKWTMLKKDNNFFLSLSNPDALPVAATFSFYPYLGHMDDPTNPTIDLNFGQTKGLFYQENEVIDSNLYSNYYRNMLDEISDKDGGVISLSLWVDPLWISNFKFNKRIYLEIDNMGQYYKVNKIESYDPGVISSTKFELIKTKNFTLPKKKGKRIFNVATAYEEIHPLAETDGNGNGQSGGGPSVIWGEQSQAKGRSVVIGDDNLISSKSMVVVGDDNIVEPGSPKGVILGSNNIIKTTATGSVVIGNNITAYEPNQVYIGSVIDSMNNWDGGIDVILDEFFDGSPMNCVDGGFNELRGLGSFTNMTSADGGIDSIL